MDENQEYLLECIKEELNEFFKGMAIYAGLLAAYWTFVA